MNIRKARSSDKNKVLDFCMNTFEWGDYIDRAWDNWISEPSSLLFVCETQLSSFTSKSDIVGVIHILQCPNNSLWIEGLRINKLYRNNGFATALLNHSIDYGIRNILNECCALVSQGNFASQKMLEKLGFLKDFTCTYYNIKLEKLGFTGKKLSTFGNMPSIKIVIKTPQLADVAMIRRYLSNPNTTKIMDDRYFDSWRFYKLNMDYLNLALLIKSNELLIVLDEDDVLVGVVMIKTIFSEDSFDKKSVIQIRYFNCIKRSLYLKVLYLLLEKYYNDGQFDNIQVFLPTFLELRKFLSFESIDYSDQFYLYAKKLRISGTDCNIPYD
ncbi:MAG TPA: GNAT family N-acetyltransferase [Candidatus Nitrosocosmicus sp.]|nr:GNAT family N-acetyltransferase [Candidatus Nitrosocosmicus sp.]